MKKDEQVKQILNSVGIDPDNIPTVIDERPEESEELYNAIMGFNQMVWGVLSNIPSIKETNEYQLFERIMKNLTEGNDQEEPIRIEGKDMKKKITHIENYSANLMYDVVGAVLKLQGTVRIRDKKGDANYNGIHSEIHRNGHTASVKEVVDYLRLAEQRGYIRGHGAFYHNHGSGGAKRWHFVKWPPYPYEELIKEKMGEKQ